MMNSTRKIATQNQNPNLSSLRLLDKHPKIIIIIIKRNEKRDRPEEFWAPGPP